MMMTGHSLAEDLYSFAHLALKKISPNSSFYVGPVSDPKGQWLKRAPSIGWMALVKKRVGEKEVLYICTSLPSEEPSHHISSSFRHSPSQHTLPTHTYL
jgi:hypothetical protein